MNTNTEILLGVLLAFIYLKPVLGTIPFPPEVGPNSLKIRTEGPGYIKVSRIIKLDNRGQPEWMLQNITRPQLDAYIKTSDNHHYFPVTAQLRLDYTRSPYFNPLLHKPEIAWIRLGHLYYTADDFKEFKVPVQHTVEDCAPYGCIYVLLPFHHTFSSKLKYHEELTEAVFASTTSSPKGKRPLAWDSEGSSGSNAADN